MTARKTTKTLSSRQKVEAHRARMRRKGMRLVQFWVPDLRLDALKAEARRQMRRIAHSAHARDDQDFIDSISEIRL